MEDDEPKEGSRWGCAHVFVAFPLAALATYLVRVRFGWGDAGWEDLVAFVGFSLVFELMVDAVGDVVRKKGRERA